MTICPFFTKSMDAAWHLTNVPVTMVGQARAVPFLTVQLSISAPRMESVFQATSVAVSRDLPEQTVVR